MIGFGKFIQSFLGFKIFSDCLLGARLCSLRGEEADGVRLRELKIWQGGRASVGDHGDVREVTAGPRDGAGPGAEVREGTEASSRRKIMKTTTAGCQTRSVYTFVCPVVSTHVCKGLRKVKRGVSLSGQWD